MIRKIKLSWAIIALSMNMFASHRVQALDCPAEVGTLFNGKNSGTYCVSKITMTWWSAFTWCEAIGGKLATWQEACPGSAVGSTCTNMKDSGGPGRGVWTATPHGENKAQEVYIPSGSYGQPQRSNSMYYFALCISSSN